MTRSRYVFQPGAEPHFITSTVVGWLPIFSRPENTQVILESFRFLQREERLTLFGWAIMVNHVHFIAAAPDLAKQVGGFRSYTARRIIDQMEQRRETDQLQALRYYAPQDKPDRLHQLWRPGTHPQVIRTGEMMRQKLQYMHENPVRKGYVDAPEHWRLSSARDYIGEPGLLEVTTDWG